MTFNSKYISFQKKTLQSRGYFCEGIEKKLINKIKKKFKYLIDVGFHNGEISKIFINKNKRIIVYGFDSNNSLSHKQIEEFKKKNIFYQEMIVANKNSFNNFYIYNQRPELSSLKKRNDYLPYITKNFTKKKCVTVTLDSFITKKKLNGNLFVKIDAEGSEKLIFYGMKKSLKKIEISGYFEYGQSWENFKFKLRDVFYLLKNLNYNVYRICIHSA